MIAREELEILDVIALILRVTRDIGRDSLRVARDIGRDSLRVTRDIGRDSTNTESN